MSFFFFLVDIEGRKVDLVRASTGGGGLRSQGADSNIYVNIYWTLVK